MSASLNLLSLTPKTLSVLKSSSASSASAPCLFTVASIKPLPKLVLSISNQTRGTACSRFVRNVAVSSEVEEDEDFSGGEEQPNFSAELKLFVGNLPFNVDSAMLADLFQQAGNVEMVEVIYDKITGRSRGFGFVTMSTIEEVEAAAQQFNGYELQGRAMRVNFGPPPAKRENSFGESRGGGYNDRSRGGYNDRSRGGGYGDRSSGGGYGDRSSGGGYGDRQRGGGYGDRPRGGAGSDNSNRVYVGNLSWGVDNLALETLFREQGKVTEARVVYDRDSGRSRGFGFVTLGSPQEVQNAISSLDGADLDGRAIRVSAAEARPSREY